MSQNSTLQRGLNTRHIRSWHWAQQLELGFSMVRQLLLKWQGLQYYLRTSLQGLQFIL